LGFLEKGNHAFIFLNAANAAEKRSFGIFLNDTYGYTCLEGEEIFSAESIGGPGNSASKFGIYAVGTLIKEHTYKNRREARYWRLELTGWKEVAIEESIFEQEISVI